MTDKWLKVKFNDSFRRDWIHCIAKQESIEPDEVVYRYLTDESHRESFDALCNRVSGCEGYVQHDGGDDYFEKEDNNWAIPDSCFEFID